MTATAVPEGTVTIDGPVHRHAMVWTWVGAYTVLTVSLGLTGILAELRDELGLSDTVTSLHGSFFGWGLLLGGLTGNRLIDRVGRRPIVLGGLVGMAAGSVILALGQIAAMTLGGAALVGLSASSLVVVLPGIVADQFGPRRQEVFTLVNMAPAIAGVLFAVVLGICIGTGLGWRWPIGIIPVLIAGAVIRSARSIDFPPQSATSANPVRLLASPTIRARWSLLVLSIMVEFATGVWAPTFLKEVGGASSGLAPVLGILSVLGLFCGRALLPLATRRLGTWVEPLAFVMAAAAGVLAWLAPWLAVRSIGIALVGVGIGPLYLISMERLFHRGGDDTVSLSALGALGSGTAVTVGPLLLGTTADAVGLRGAFAVVPALALVGALWATVLRRRDLA